METTFADKVFFCNSGAEACEGVIKAARRFHTVAGNPERNRIITCHGAFHGRTLATLAAAGNPKYLEGFGPEMPGFDHVPYNDLEAVRAAVGPETAAVMVEPVQGEGGVNVGSAEYLAGLRALCDEAGILLIFDEVQTGVGRTGRFFSHEWAGVTPDLMAVAKGIGGGFRWAPCWRPSTPLKASRPACTARRSAAIRWRRRPATLCSTSSWRRASSKPSSRRRCVSARASRACRTSSRTWWRKFAARAC